MVSGRRILGAVLLALPALRALAQSPALSSERVINSYTTDNQRRPRVASGDAAGDFVVAWESNGQDGYGYGIFGQWQPGFGIVPPEFQANIGYTAGNEIQPDVSMHAFSGDFVVVFDNAYGFGTAIDAQLFDNTGSPIGTPLTVDILFGETDLAPRIATNPFSGAFVVVWASTYNDGDGFGVFGQRLDASGSPLGGRFQVNSYTTDYQIYPAVARSVSGFVVVWQSIGQDGSSSGIFGQRYDDAGNPLGGEFQVNTYTTGPQNYPAVGMDLLGNFVVVWSSQGQDGSGSGVFGQRFDPGGNRLGPEFRVNTETASDQGEAAVAAGPADGSFCVVWSSYATDIDGGIAGRLFDGEGRPKGPEFPINAYTTGSQAFPSVAYAGDGSGSLIVSWQSSGQDGSQNGVIVRSLLPDAAQPMAVDAHSGSGTSSNVNGVLEAGETVQIEPAWKNVGTLSLPFSGTASGLTGPPGPTYTLDDTSAGYGTIAPGAIANCYDATAGHDCFVATVSGSRPSPHWDATFTETLNFPISKVWTLHIGESFPDVLTSHQFYPYIENLFHNSITGGCGGGNYCPGASVTRAQMAVFLLKARHGSTFLPPPCAGVFPDVTCPSQFADWIEELFAEGITGGCGGGNYCPSNPVTRAQMAVFLLKAEHVAGYAPPGCTGVFGDVACPSQFADWIEQLATEGITGGCGGGNYCPNNPNTRGQMAVFLVKTFGLLLYGP